MASGAVAAHAASAVWPGQTNFAAVSRPAHATVRRPGNLRRRLALAAGESSAASAVVYAPTDPYLTLGINPGASTDEIRKAYRKVAIQKHPDRNGGTPEAVANFQAVIKAYEALAPDGRKTTETPDEEEVLAGAIEALLKEQEERRRTITERTQQIAEIFKKVEEDEAQLLQLNKGDEETIKELGKRLGATRARRSEVVGNLRASSAASAALAGAAIAGPIGAAAGLIFGTFFADNDDAAGKVARSMGKLGQKLGDWVEKQADDVRDGKK